MWKELVAAAFALSASSAMGQVPEPNYFADLTKPMTFMNASSGGNCHTCTWISAQGTITKDSVKAFEAFLIENEYENLNGMAIHLNSSGGSLLGALALGERIRAVGANTLVAETSGVSTPYGVRDLFLESDDAQCASACVFLFAAGVNRYVSDRVGGNAIGYQKLGKLGVHQFYDPKVVNQSPDVVFDGWARSNDQLLTGLILEYLDQMGVSAQLLSIGMSVPPWKPIKWLSDKDIVELRLDTIAQPANARLVGYSNGVGVVEVVREGRNGSYRYEYFCGPEGAAMLKISVDWKSGYTVEGLEEWNLLAHLKLSGFEGMHRTKQTFETSESGTLRSVSVYLGDGADLEKLKTVSNFAFEGASSSHGWQFASDFDYFLSEPFDGFHLLPRLCLN